MNLFLRVEHGEMRIATELQDYLKGIYYMGRELNELDLWLQKDREIPIYIHFLQYDPDYPCANVLISNPSPSGDMYTCFSLAELAKIIIKNSRPFNLFLLRDENLSFEEYCLRVGDGMMFLVGEEDIICWVEVKNIDELVSLKIRGIQNLLVPVPVLNFLEI